MPTRTCTNLRAAGVLATLALLLAVEAVLAHPLEAAKRNSNPTLTTSQIAIVSDHEDPLFREDSPRYRYIVVRDNLHDRVGELRRAHPEAEIILYKNVAFTLREPGCPFDPFQGGGVSWCQANRHEAWFLHDKRTGARIASDGYPTQRAMNIAHPGYRRTWLRSVRARLADALAYRSGARYDGVWMDDTNLYPGHGMGGRIAELRDGEYRRAMVGFVDEVTPVLREAGFVTIVNLGMNPWERAQRRAALRVAGDVSVVNREGLVRWGEGELFTDPGGPVPHWRDEVRLAEDVQRRGARFHAITYGRSDDRRVQRYARATFLMAWNGRDGSAFAFRSVDGGRAYSPSWAAEIGEPRGKRRHVGRGWRRSFTRGIALVNSSPRGSQRFRFAKRHRTPGGRCVRSVRLGAQNALIMRRC